MKKDCKGCAYCVRVNKSRFWCRKLGVVVYPHINGSATCCWWREEVSEDEMRDLPEIFP